MLPYLGIQKRTKDTPFVDFFDNKWQHTSAISAKNKK